jgi:uncharacterized membrane protein YhdT
MKKLPLLITALLVIFLSSCRAIQPVWIINTTEMMFLTLLYLFVAVLTALYLSNRKSLSTFFLWLIVGCGCMPIALVAAAFKYYFREK